MTLPAFTHLPAGDLVLASASIIRAKILHDAGLVLFLSDVRFARSHRSGADGNSLANRTFPHNCCSHLAVFDFCRSTGNSLRFSEWNALAMALVSVDVIRVFGVCRLRPLVQFEHLF